ncbi:MAG: hypothetical protein LBO82_03195 [Synergistaceae bacterium]|jgi:hypothetical protein|nr:hypothetical protein [Synergistaceae bacterium]
MSGSEYNTDAERRWEETSRALERQAAERRSESAARERVGSSEAARAIGEARRAYAEAEKTPHRLFFPNGLEAFGNALSDAEKLSKTGLNEAAAAVSISARSGIERLACDVADKRAEWRELFAMLKARVDALRLVLNGELSEWSRRGGETQGEKQEKKQEEERKKRCEIEIDYWSWGAFGELKRKTDELAALIESAAKAGEDEYLKSPGALGIDELREKIASADELSGRIGELGNLHELRCDASWERREWADAIIGFLTDEINLDWLEEESGWRRADESVRAGGPFREYVKLQYGDENIAEDARDRLELVFRNMAGRKVFVYLVPEERGAGVKNRVLLYADSDGGEPFFGREILSHVRESLNKDEESGIFALIGDVSGLLAHPDPAVRDAGRSLERRILER